MTASDPYRTRTYNGYTIQRNTLSDAGNPYDWYWIITSPAQSALPAELKGYWLELSNLLIAIGPGKHWV